MEILRVKKAQLPTPPIVSYKKRNRRITSAAAILDDGAGPSNAIIDTEDEEDELDSTDEE